MAVWKKHRFSELNEDQDEQDKIIAGLVFSVRYVGSTYLKDDFENTEELQLMEFLKSTVESFQLSSKLSVIQLVLDVSGVVFYDCEGRELENFKLKQIRDVIYCNNNKQYAKYIMLVGQAERDLCVKAHFLVCQNKEEVKYLYKTFVEAFELGVHMSSKKYSNGKMSTQENKARNGPSTDIAVNSQLTNITKLYKSKPTSTVYEGGPRGLSSPLDNSKRLLLPLPKQPILFPLDQENDFQGNCDASSYPDDDFTEFARSRSKSSDTSFSVGLARVSSAEDDVFW